MRVLIMMLTVILFGCGYSHTKIPSESNGAQGEANNGTGAEAPPDFAAIKDQVFQNHCTRCHSEAGGNRGGVNLESYSRVKPIVQTILSAVNIGIMPPSGMLPSSAKMLLVNWIQAGAPEFSVGSPDEPQNPDPEPAPVPCEDYIQRIEHELLTNFNRPSHDDCDEDDHDDDH